LLYQRIRNLTLKFLPPGQLITKEIPKYDQAIVLEALHNCIAHQDYTRNERVLVTERIDELEFRSAGHFFDGSPEDYLLTSRTPGKYRNAFLARAMSHLGMVDRMGFGIRDVMFQGQAKSYRPLPFYEPDSSDYVTLHLPGHIIDENYSRLLLANPDLKLSDIIALDRIQKKLLVPSEMVNILRKRGWVEGRWPNIHISAAIAATTGQKVDYIRTRKQDDDHYKKLVTDYLDKWGEAKPKEIRDLLLSKLSDGLTDAQRRNKVRNLLTAMRKEGRIVADGVKNAARWKLNPAFTEERPGHSDQITS
jgi:ATP-dependent DNA helicase RecG